MMAKYDSVWEALEQDPVKQENLRLRSQLLIEINTKLDRCKQKQEEIAKQLNTTQPRVSALRKGKINEFRLDMLVDYATRLGLRVSINIAA